MSLIYKILPRAEWEAAVAEGVFGGSAVDRRDGYIHFSTAAQAGETLRRHFAGQTGLVMVAVESESLVLDLKWEPSRGDELFPHLYAPLPTACAVSVEDIPDEREPG
jgi:uncharacterized protein (DUF952 family)